MSPAFATRRRYEASAADNPVSVFDEYREWVGTGTLSGTSATWNVDRKCVVGFVEVPLLGLGLIPIRNPKLVLPGDIATIELADFFR